MHRYESSTHRVAFGLAAVALTALTMVVSVVVPATVEADTHAPGMLAASKVAPLAAKVAPPASTVNRLASTATPVASKLTPVTSRVVGETPNSAALDVVAAHEQASSMAPCTLPQASLRPEG